jgi:hypothetical protein
MAKKQLMSNSHKCLSWIPCKLAPDLYEECAICHEKRYRDPEKRRKLAERTIKYTSTQASLF